MVWVARVLLCMCLCGGGWAAATAAAQDSSTATKPPKKRNEKAFQDAVRRLKSDDANARAAAADEMGRRGYRYRREIAVLLRPVLLHDPATVVRAAAGRALGRLGAKEAVPELIKALADPAPEVRVVSAAALWRIPDPSATGALLKRVDDPDPAVREWVALALGVIGDKQAVPAMVARLSDAARPVRLAAIRSLGRIGDPAGVEPLVAYLQAGGRSKEEKEECINAIAGMRGPRAVSALLALLEAERDPAHRVLMIIALGQIGDGRALEALRKLAQRAQVPAVRQAATEAVKQLSRAPQDLSNATGSP